MQAWLAERVGCDPSEMSNYVRGLHVPRADRRAAIAAALGRTEEELWPSHAAQDPTPDAADDGQRKAAA